MTRAQFAAICWSLALAAVACTASAPRPGAKLAAAALACDDPSAPRDSSPIYELGAAETSATPERGNRLPSLGASGRLVTVRFVIDTLGRPDLCTASILRESHAGLGALVLEHVADWRYIPARHQGRAVRQLMALVIESSGP